MNIKIYYNTISFKSQIICNDKIIKKNLEQTIIDVNNERITTWIEKFIIRIKEEINNDIFSLEINGCDLYEKNFIDSLLVKETESINKYSINSISESSITKKYNDINAFINYTLNSKDDIVKEAIEPNKGKIVNLRNKKIEVPVIATMSSGKTTLLNALIGQDFLFEDTGTATATNCTIKINNKLNEFVAKATEGSTKLEESKNDIKDFFLKWNSDEKNEEHYKLMLNLEGPVKDLNLSNLELNFIDTPGPNSSKYENHKLKTFSYLKDNQKLPIVLYVLDPEKIDSRDDDNTLKEISDVLKNNQQNVDRIIFIYNKVDRENLEKKPINEILINVKKFLGKYNIDNPKIFPLSSKYAKFSQLISVLSRNEKNKLSNFRNDFIPEPDENYQGYQLLEYAPINENQKQQLKKRVSKSELDADLVYSGLAALKTYIEDYVNNHHQKKQYKDLNDIATKVLTEIETKIILKKQKKNREKTNKEKVELNNKRRDALNTICEIELDKSFIQDVVGKIDIRFSKLKDKLRSEDYLTIDDSKTIIEEANLTISNLQDSIETDLVSKMNDKLDIYLNKMKQVVAGKFELSNLSIEEEAFNAELINKINVLDIDNIEHYKETQYEYVKKPKLITVKSKKWYKRLFGLKDTKEVKEIHRTKKTIMIKTDEIYNKFLDPLSNQFKNIIDEFERDFDEKRNKYYASFEKHINDSFEIALRSVYERFYKSLNSIDDLKNYDIERFDEIISTLKKFEIRDKK